MSSVPASRVESNDQRSMREREGESKGSDGVQVRVDLAQRSVLAFLLSMSLSPALHRYPDWRVFDSKSCCQSSRCPRQPGRQPYLPCQIRDGNTLHSNIPDTYYVLMCFVRKPKIRYSKHVRFSRKDLHLTVAPMGAACSEHSTIVPSTFADLAPTTGATVVRRWYIRKL
jgi:hypothetical protein